MLDEEDCLYEEPLIAETYNIERSLLLQLPVAGIFVQTVARSICYVTNCTNGAGPLSNAEPGFEGFDASAGESFFSTTVDV